jgi:hypothetical protein
MSVSVNKLFHLKQIAVIEVLCWNRFLRYDFDLFLIGSNGIVKIEDFLQIFVTKNGIHRRIVPPIDTIII